MTSDPTQSVSMKRWLKITLIISLSLNVLVIGAVVGHMSFGKGKSDHQNSRHSRTQLPYSQALSQNDRRAIWQNLKAANRSQNDVKPQFEEGLAILEADQFDAKQFEEHLTQFATRSNIGHAARRKALVDHISQMSHSERAEYATKLRKVIATGRPFKKR